jgi:hypothetical protein
VVWAFAAGYAAICLATLPTGPFTAPDSIAYVEMQPIVPLGYPAFLRVFGASAAVKLQPLIFAAALGWLGVEVLRVGRQVILALVVMLGVAMTPQLREYHSSVLTESLFASGLVSFLAAITTFTREPGRAPALTAAVIAGLTATVRRAAYAFLPVLVLMVLLQRRQLARGTWGTLAAAVLPMVAVLGIEAVATRAVHGNAATSLTGRHLFAKAALIDDGRVDAVADDPTVARLQQALQVDYAPVRSLIARAPRELKPSLVVYYETCLQGPCVDTLRASLGAMSEARKNGALARAATARIAAAPVEFAALTATHYESLWTVYKLRHPRTAPALAAFLNAHRPLPFERESFKVTPDQAIAFESSPLVRIVQPLVLMAGFFTGGLALCGFIAAVRARLSALVAAAALSALTAHGCLLLSAIAAAGISRFMLSVFPAVVTALALGVWWAGQAALTRLVRVPRYH